ncbi:MAG: hypothetical protein AAB865_00585 [Patescibacteria group bacterium]
MQHIFRKATHIATHPGRIVSHPLKKMYERHYKDKKFARTLFVVDILVLAAIATSVGLILAFTVFAPAKIVDQVHIDATVAPTIVVSGDLSTLVIRYENASGEALRFARLHLDFPAHFELKDTETSLEEIAPQTYNLDTLDPHESGSLKIHGVMFGDVGGEQKFTSTLTFQYGERDKSATKTSEHTFSPARSTLALQLILPERVVQGQQVEGKILYKNTGTVDFPEISVEPVWPKDFILIQSSPALTNGRFTLSALKALEEGEINFTGQLPPTETTEFVFHPSFSFGETRYKQDSLSQTVKLLPSQLKVATDYSADTITPGGSLTVTVNYEHVGELPLKNLTINLNTLNQPLFQKPSTIVGETITALGPGDTGSVTTTLRFNASIDPRAVTSYENLSAAIKTFVSYEIVQDGTASAPISLMTSSDALKITSPIILESFGRYTSPQGDQIGRGPLPPLVGEETKYWVFMTIERTTNKLETVKMEAELGPGVSFTGKQSISYGESLDYDASSNSVRWTIGTLPATLAPDSPVISVAFEVAITPSESMVGSTPTLLASPLVTARDTFTGAFVTARGVTITTNLPHDEMAAGFGVVETF